MNEEERNKVVELCEKHRTGKYISYDDHMFLQKMLHSYKKEYEEIFNDIPSVNRAIIVKQKNQIIALTSENNVSLHLLYLYQSKIRDLEKLLKENNIKF